MSNAVNPTHHRIVIGVDGSAPSIEALQWGAKLAATLSVGVEAVTSWSWPSGYGMVGVPGSWNPEADAKTTQDNALLAAFPGSEPVGLHRTVREGHAAQVLLDASEDAAMLVVGSRGHGGRRAADRLGECARRGARPVPGTGDPRPHPRRAVI